MLLLGEKNVQNVFWKKYAPQVYDYEYMYLVNEGRLVLGEEYHREDEYQSDVSQAQNSKN